MWSTTNMDRTLFSTDGQSNYDTSCRANWFYLKLWSVPWPKIIELDEVNTNKNNRTGFPLTAIVRFVQGKEQLISTQETSPVVPLDHNMNSWALFLTSPNEPSVQALHWLWQSQHLDFGGNWFFPTEVIMRGEFGHQEEGACGVVTNLREQRREALHYAIRAMGGVTLRQKKEKN